MKIALIAMSGIRACDQELLDLGLTLPGFVERSEAIASLPSLGLLTLAGMTPSQHDVYYFEVRDLGEAPDDLADYDLAAISTFSAQSLEAYALADRLRAAGVPVVIGGLHATVLPDEASAHADAVIVGDGETVWREVLEDAERRALRPIYGDRLGRFDLADAPMPRYDLLDMNRYNRITVQTSRGCPFQCEFCASSILFSPKYRQKPAERVLAEIDRVRELWARPFIEFADDNGLVNRNYWKRLLPELASRRVRWFTESDISIADDPELLEALARSGCAQVLIGLESPTPTGLRGLELRADWKRKRQADYADAVRRIQSFGIRVNACFVVGLDGHTPEVFDAVYDFAERTCVYDVQATIPTPFPGTPFYDRLKRDGRLTHDGEWNRCTLFDLNFTPSPMGEAELRTGFRQLIARLYTADFTKHRRDGFHRQWRAARAAG